MNLKKIIIENFRTYKNRTEIEFNNLTAFIGKNDCGKSTILEALDIFFNSGNGIIKLDSEDINKENKNQGNEDIFITAIFDNFPSSITIDATNPTSLQNEYLLNKDGFLEIIKKYPKAGKEKVFIKANHPTNPKCSDLLTKKIADLKKDLGNIECDDKTKSASIRKAIWNHYHDDLQLNEIEIDVSKEDAKNIWDQLKFYMPIYALFQSDRKNSDSDDEVQDPLKAAVSQILNDDSIKSKLQEISQTVEEKLKEVSTRTLEKLREMDPEVANSLNPIIPKGNELKWTDVFKRVSISGDNNIPINKRGSGIKRLILINFFRAEADRRKTERNVPNIIYAIEEPETAQHPDYQRKLIEAFKELSMQANTQIIITTHSPYVVKQLDFDNLRLIIGNGERISVENVNRNDLPYPSLNEINYVAFNEADEEYHNELYGFIESEGKLGQFKNGKPTRSYLKENRDRRTQNLNVTTLDLPLSEYIRHQIHHPENQRNTRYTREELNISIELMRDFIRNEIRT